MAQQFAVSSNKLNDYLQAKEPLLLFDLRSKELYEAGHIDGSVHAVCDARAKETIMPNIPKNVKTILVHDDVKMSSEIVTMMRSFGLDAYYLDGGIKEWQNDLISGSPPDAIKPNELWKRMPDQNLFLLDVREPEEFSDFKIPNSVNIPLAELFTEKRVSEIPKDQEIVTVCPRGNRAMVATFALAKNGISSRVLEDGLAGWSQVLNPVKISESPTIIQVEKIGKGCLSYVVISNNEAIVIDPLSPATEYHEIASRENAKISKILDTHQHADHISTAQSLSELTGGIMYESGLESWDREFSLLHDGDELTFGTSKLRVIHTPGHTPGSLSYVVDEKFVFTGDILFIESIGRPDLRDQAQEFAGHLYDSLHKKLLKLPPDTVVLPTHHGMSVKPENGVYSTTIEKAKQHDVLKLPFDEFVSHVVGVTVPRPMNYQKIIQINKGTVPLIQTEIPDLELGPNRCSIAGV